VTVRYMLVPVEKVEHPDRSGLFMHHLKSWWLHVPDVGVIFTTSQRPRAFQSVWNVSPQCNNIEPLAQRRSRMFPIRGMRVEVLYIASAWVPTDHEGASWLPPDWIVRTLEAE
jgi:hypothetical protein